MIPALLYQAKPEGSVGLVNVTAAYRRARRMAQDAVRAAFAAPLRTYRCYHSSTTLIRSSRWCARAAAKSAAR